MSDIEELRNKLEELQIITRQLRIENNSLTERVRALENSNSTQRPSNSGPPTTNTRIQTRSVTNNDILAVGSRGRNSLDFNRGDRVEVIRPTCPGRLRRPNLSDKFATVTRSTRDWIYFTCDSGVNTKRHPTNLILISRNNGN